MFENKDLENPFLQLYYCFIHHILICLPVKYQNQASDNYKKLKTAHKNSYWCNENSVIVSTFWGKSDNWKNDPFYERIVYFYTTLPALISSFFGWFIQKIWKKSPNFLYNNSNFLSRMTRNTHLNTHGKYHKNTRNHVNLTRFFLCLHRTLSCAFSGKIIFIIKEIWFFSRDFLCESRKKNLSLRPKESCKETWFII